MHNFDNLYSNMKRVLVQLYTICANWTMIAQKRSCKGSEVSKISLILAAYPYLYLEKTLHVILCSEVMQIHIRFRSFLVDSIYYNF